MNKNVTLVQFAHYWIHGPIPADLMADLVEILEDENYPPEKRVHQVVWQAIKSGLENMQMRPSASSKKDADD